MAKASGGTRKNMGNNKPTQTMIKGEYNNIQKIIDSIAGINDNEAFADSLGGYAFMHDISMPEAEALDALQWYIRDSFLDNIGKEEQKLLKSVVEQSPNTYTSLYRGMRIDKSEVSSFIDKIKIKKDLSLKDFTQKNREVISVTDKKDSFWLNGSVNKGQVPLKISINGSTRGLDLHKAGEQEVLISASTKVSIKSIIYNKKNGGYEIKLKRR